ncbi:MAG: hypothetical protein NZQ09_13105 [Chloroflexus sp.]|nr:hypothetical protein [Chloroflexus sp.]
MHLLSAGIATPRWARLAMTDGARSRRGLPRRAGRGSQWQVGVAA